MSLKQTLKQIEQLKKELDALHPLSAEAEQKLWKKFRLEWNYNSNHIEGNTLTYGETVLLLINGKTTGDHEVREYEEMKAHDLAIHEIKEWAKNKDRDLSEVDIRQLNKTILKEPFWKEAITDDGQPTRRLIKIGEYKEFRNSVRLATGEIFEYASPTDTPKLMKDLIEWYRSGETTNALVLAAELHYRFIRIHPFDDGNGRVARLVVNFVLMKNGYPPIIVKSSDKSGYLTALQKADAGNVEAFVEYMAEQLIWSLNIALLAAKGESVDEPGDLDKKLSLLEKELQTIDPNEEVKKQFSKEVFLEIYKSWGTELLKEAIPVIQKFNKLFTGSGHSININSAIGYVRFVNESADDVLEKLNLEVNKNTLDRFSTHDCEISFNTFFGTFTKGGLNTFGCNYSFRIKFDINKYEVFMDDFTERPPTNTVKIFERLLHKPLTKKDIEGIVERFGNTIFHHIDFNTKKIGLR